MNQPTSGRCLIFLDTSSLLASCWNGDDRRGEQVRHDQQKESTFWTDEVGELSQRGTLILPLRNRDELIKHSRSSAKPLLAKQAGHIIAKLEALVSQKRVEIVGDRNDPFADAILLSVALKFRTQHTLWFITQDNALARDLYAITRFESVQPRGGQQFEIRRIGPSGKLERFRNLERNSGKPTPVERPAAREALAQLAAEPPKAWWKRAGT